MGALAEAVQRDRAGLGEERRVLAAIDALRREEERIAVRVRLDLWYIRNWSLRLDLLILIKTIFEVLRRRNAY